MKLCYQVATPDVALAENVTAYQGNLQKSFGDLAKLGYDGVELMTLDPSRLDWNEVKETAKYFDLSIGMVCTGEIYGQLQLSFTNPEPSVRREAIERVKNIIDFAGFLHAKVNIGRVRGRFNPGVAKTQTIDWAVEALQSISDYAAPKCVEIALETVTILQTNFINTMEEGASLIGKVGRDNLKMMMDIFHLNIEEKNLYEAIKTFYSDNIYVHLSDNNRRYPGNCGLNFREIIRTFHDLGYDGIFCTEIFQSPSMEEAAKNSIKFLAPIFKEIYGRDIK